MDKISPRFTKRLSEDEVWNVSVGPFNLNVLFLMVRRYWDALTVVLVKSFDGTPFLYFCSARTDLRVP